MTRPFTGEPSDAEKADAKAYISFQKDKNHVTATIWRKAWFRLTGGLPITSPFRCEKCGLHMTGRTRYEACRLCGHKEPKG